MPGTPPFTVAADLSSITIQKLTRATSGAFSTNGSAYNIVALLDRMGRTRRKRLENIKAVTSTRDNMVPVSTGSSMRITALRRSDAGQVLQNIQYNASWCLVTWLEGTETHGPSYFTVGDLEDGIDGEGRQTVTLSLEPCDPGQIQDPYATTTAAS